jgi:hypothetical protein
MLRMPMRHSKRRDLVVRRIESHDGAPKVSHPRESFDYLETNKAVRIGMGPQLFTLLFQLQGFNIPRNLFPWVALIFAFTFFKDLIIGQLAVLGGRAR